MAISLVEMFDSFWGGYSDSTPGQMTVIVEREEPKQEVAMATILPKDLLVHLEKDDKRIWEVLKMKHNMPLLDSPRATETLPWPVPSGLVAGAGGLGTGTSLGMQQFANQNTTGLSQMALAQFTWHYTNIKRGDEHGRKKDKSW